MIVNEPLIRKTIKAIEQHEDNWDQGTWIGHPDEDFSYQVPKENLCGTTLCFAGFAVRVHLGREAFRQVAFTPKNGTVVLNHDYAWKEKAQEFLGLSEYQAAAIFSARNHTVADLKRKINEVTGIEFD